MISNHFEDICVYKFLGVCIMFVLNHCKRYFFLLVFPLLITSYLVPGKDRFVEDYFRGGRSRSLDWLKVRTQLREELCKLDRQIAELAPKEGSSDGIREQLKDLRSDRENVQSLLKGSFGDVFFRGIAGDNWKMIEDLRVGNNIGKGVLYGAGLRGAVSVGKTIGKKVDSYSETLLGGLLGKLESVVRAIGNACCHKGCEPFTTNKINSWKTLVSGNLRNIENMLKDAERSDSRSRDAILKELKSDGDKGTQEATLWQDFIEDFVQTCQDLIKEIDGHVGYYKNEKNGYGVKNCSNRLRNKLFKLKEWVCRARTLKEFSNIPEIKSILPAMRNSLDAYFVNLNSLLDPTNSKNNRIRTTASYPRHDYSAMDHDNSYPGAI